MAAIRRARAGTGLTANGPDEDVRCATVAMVKGAATEPACGVITIMEGGGGHAQTTGEGVGEIDLPMMGSRQRIWLLPANPLPILLSNLGWITL